MTNDSRDTAPTLADLDTATTGRPLLDELGVDGALGRVLDWLASLDKDDRGRGVHDVIAALVRLRLPARVRQGYRDAIVRDKYILRDDWRDAEREARAGLKAAERAAAEERRAAARAAGAAEDGEELPPPTAPMMVARQLLDGHRADGHLTLRYWRGNWMRWEQTRWVEVEQDALKTWAYHKTENAVFLDTSTDLPETKPWSPNRRRIADLLDALLAAVYLPETVDPPAWLAAAPVLTDGSRVPADEVVACANGLLHVASRTLLGLTATYFNRVAVPFDYDPDAPTPKHWLEFLGQLWPEDPAMPGIPEPVMALQEFFGYVLSGRTDLQKILMLIGPTRSGKGTIARVLTALVGKDNVAGPALASFGANFGLEPLLGKPLGVISDARLGSGNVHQVVERLLSISGEDRIDVDRKHLKAWTGKLPTRLVVLSNELPRFGDASGAIAHRFIVLVQTVSFLGREDSRLTSKLLGELPGIMNWALDGLARLAAKGAFTEPRSSTDAITTLQDLASPVAAFVRDYCQVGAAHEVLVDDLFATWKHWCEENGRDRPGTVQTLGRDLRAVVPGLTMTRPRSSSTEAKRERWYAGIRLNEAHNGLGRGPSRTTPASAPEKSGSGSPVRDGPRPTPLWAERCPICGEPIDPAAGTIHPGCESATSGHEPPTT
jgi:putative DNA primase/helicase